jgi:uncharacterized protein YciI
MRRAPERGRETSPRFAFFYLMKDEADRVHLAVPNHVSHWRELHLAGYLGGPFEDRTGGLITFEADDAGHAERAVETDPSWRNSSWTCTGSRNGPRN